MMRLQKNDAGGRTVIRAGRPSRPIGITLLALSISLTAMSAVAQAPDDSAVPQAVVPFSTNVWGDKFKYGAYSTLVATHLLRNEFPNLLARLNGTITAANAGEIRSQVQMYVNRFKSLPEFTVAQIVDYAKNDRSNSIFEEERSILQTDAQNARFIAAMATNPNLAPVDNLIRSDRFTSSNFQFNAHRALYNSGYGIPQNSLAGIVAAYAAGIRSIELDVMETSESNDNPNSIVIHDMVTNRESGSYHLPPIYVERRPYSQIENTKIAILNPIGYEQTVEETGINRLMLTDDVLNFVRLAMPELTIYMDARNNAPVSVIDLLEHNAEYRDNVVIKVYPFSLKGGAYSIVKEFARRQNISEQSALERLKSINPHMLVVLGSALGQANEESFVADYTDFTWAKFLSERVNLPFSRTANPSSNSFQGASIFSNAELTTIEARSFTMFRWAMEFPAIANTLVYQVNVTASLANLVTNQSSAAAQATFKGMPQDVRLASAVFDNFLRLFSRVRSGALEVHIELGGSQSSQLKDQVSNSILGLSDRYPDFTLVNRDASGAPIQNTLRDFMYRMDGVVYEDNSYSPSLLRSTAALVERQRELQAIGFPVNYATTDLPTDLRAVMMGIITTDLRYRYGSLVKPRYTPSNISTFQIPNWTQRLYGNAAARNVAKFDRDIAAIRTDIIAINDTKNLITSITLSHDKNVVLVNQAAIERFSRTEPFFVRELSDSDVNSVLYHLNEQLKFMSAQFESKRSDFYQYFGEEAPSIQMVIIGDDLEM